MFAQFSSFFSKMGPLTSDIFILLALLVIFMVIGLYSGKNRIISFILAFYPTVFIYKNLPFIDKLLFLKGDNMIILNKVLIFIIILIVISVIIVRHTFSSSGYGGLNSITTLAVPSIGATILILVFSYSVVDLSILHTFSPIIADLFSSTSKIFWWTIAPLLLLIV